MRALFILTGFITILLVLVGILKNRHDRKKFKEFLESLKRKQRLNEEPEKEVAVPGKNPIRSKIRARYRPRKVGLNWTGASVHGAVPRRKDRREFLDGKR